MLKLLNGKNSVKYYFMMKNKMSTIKLSMKTAIL